MMKMQSRAWWGVAMILALAGFVGDGFAQVAGGWRTTERPEVGFLAPDFTLPDLNGTRVKLSDLRGKKAVFLSFWASWCPSCQEEMPTIEQLHQEFKLRGLEVVAVSIDTGPSDVTKFVKTHSVTFRAGLDRNGETARKYRVTAIPTHYFIDKDGVIRSREVVVKDWSRPENWKAIERLLQ